MLFSRSLIGAMLVLAPPATVQARPPTGGGKPSAYCCPNDDSYVPEYFDECEGCYAIPSEEVRNDQECLALEFRNFPGGEERRLNELDLVDLSGREGARVVELANGRQIVELPDGRRMVPFPDDLPRGHRALQGVPGLSFPGQVIDADICFGVENVLCCCDYTGTGVVPPNYPNEPYEYEECCYSCYFFDNLECDLLNSDPSAVMPRPLNVLPECPGKFRPAVCDAGLGLGGLDPHFRVSLQCRSNQRCN